MTNDDEALLIGATTLVVLAAFLAAIGGAL